MKTRQINIFLFLFLMGLTINVNGQTVKKKVERIFDNKRNLTKKREELYSSKGKLLKTVRASYDYNESKVVTNYLYDDKG